MSIKSFSANLQRRSGEDCFAAGNTLLPCKQRRPVERSLHNRTQLHQDAAAGQKDFHSGNSKVFGQVSTILLVFSNTLLRSPPAVLLQNAHSQYYTSMPPQFVDALGFFRPCFLAYNHVVLCKTPAPHCTKRNLLRRAALSCLSCHFPT